MDITIFVKCCIGNRNMLVPIRIHSSDTVLSLKQKIKDKTGEAICKQKFFGAISGGIMGYNDDITIKSIGLLNMSTIYLEHSRFCMLSNYIESVSVMNLFGKENMIYKFWTIIPSSQYYYSVFPIIKSPIKFIKIRLRKDYNYMPVIGDITASDIVEVYANNIKYNVKILSISRSTDSLEFIIALDKIISNGIVRIRINGNKKIGINSDKEYFFQDIIKTACCVGYKHHFCLTTRSNANQAVIVNTKDSAVKHNAKDYFAICEECNECVCIECISNIKNNPNANILCSHCGHNFL